jgi:hypothetical protein
LSIVKQWIKKRKDTKIQSEESKEMETSFFTTPHLNKNQPKNQTDIHAFDDISFSMHGIE